MCTSISPFIIWFNNKACPIAQVKSNVCLFVFSLLYHKWCSRSLANRIAPPLACIDEYWHAPLANQELSRLVVWCMAVRFVTREKLAAGEDKMYELKRMQALQLSWKHDHLKFSWVVLEDVGKPPTMYCMVFHTFESKADKLFFKGCSFTHSLTNTVKLTHSLPPSQLTSPSRRGDRSYLYRYARIVKFVCKFVASHLWHSVTLLCKD